MHLWDLDPFRERLLLHGHTSSVSTFAFSADGSRIFSGSLDQTLKVWNASNGAELLTLRGHTKAIKDVAVSPDGRTVASASADGTVKLWETGRPPAGYAKRRIVEAARACVNDRFEALTFAADVVTALRNDVSLDPLVKTTAISIATARGDNPYLLNQASWSVVQSPGRKPEAYQLAWRQVARACRVMPRSGEYRTTLGAALYRLGRDDEALQALGQAEARLADEWVVASPHAEPHLAPNGHRPVNVAFTAMALQRLGRSRAAEAAVRQVDVWMTERRFEDRPELQRLHQEVRDVLGFTGQTKTDVGRASPAAS